MTDQDKMQSISRQGARMKIQTR